MAEANSYATFASANYPAQSDVVNTAPTYGDPINVLDGTYDPGTAPPQLAAADVRTGVDTGANGPGTLAVPAVGRVILGVATDNTVGTYAQLPEADGRQGEQWGEDGTEYTGTLDPGAGGTVPAASDVRFGVAVGDSTGTMAVPPKTRVIDGIATDDGFGNYAQISEANGRINVQWGANGNEYTGQLDPDSGECSGYPAEDLVFAATIYGDAGQFTGNRTDAQETDVRLGVQYAANGVSKTGTWNGETGDPGDATWIGE